MWQAWKRRTTCSFSCQGGTCSSHRLSFLLFRCDNRLVAATLRNSSFCLRLFWCNVFPFLFCFFRIQNSRWRRTFAVKYEVIVGKHVFRAPVSQDYKKKEVSANYPRRAAVQRLPIRICHLTATLRTYKREDQGTKDLKRIEKEQKRSISSV